MKEQWDQANQMRQFDQRSCTRKISDTRERHVNQLRIGQQFQSVDKRINRHVTFRVKYLTL